MNFLDLISKRQSCRKYHDRPVEREAIERCLEAARLAPSACNSQPWRFIVVQDPALRKKTAEAAFSGVFRMNSFAINAPVLVLMIRERSRYAAQMGGQVRGVQYNLIDLGIAGEHFILQAAEEGLGTCWIGWFNERAVKKVLGLPWHVKVDLMISLGYSAEERLREKDRCSREGMSEIR